MAPMFSVPFELERRRPDREAACGDRSMSRDRAGVPIGRSWLCNRPLGHDGAHQHHDRRAELVAEWEFGNGPPIYRDRESGRMKGQGPEGNR